MLPAKKKICTPVASTGTKCVGPTMAAKENTLLQNIYIKTGQAEYLDLASILPSIIKLNFQRVLHSEL